jgi:site-specific DNA-methyltransferase (adenine-specific)
MVELNRIYNEDCLDTMSRIPDEFIDLTITSPPYNLGNTHHTGNKRHQPYDDNMPEDEYQQWQIRVLEEMYRITKSTGSLIYNHKNRIRKGISITPYIWLLQTSWVIKQEIVWFNRSQNFDKIRFYPMTERLYWLAKSPKTKLFNVISHHDLFDTKEWKSEGTNKDHTRSFPLKMVLDMLLCFPDAKVIYDPFMGSGTVAVASVLSGREYIGSEISSEYCALAESEVLGIWS